MEENIKSDCSVPYISQDKFSTLPHNEQLWIKEYRRIRGYNKHSLAIRTGACLILIGIFFITGFLLEEFETEQTKYIAYIFLALGIASCIAMAISLYYFIFRPINELTNYVIRMAGGEMEKIIPSTERKDEIGYIAGALNVYHLLNIVHFQTAHEVISKEEHHFQDREHETQDIVHDFENSVKRVIEGVVSTTADAIFSTTKSLTEITDRSFAHSEELEKESRSSNETAEKVVIAAEDLAKGIAEVNNQVEESAKVASEALAETETASVTVNKLEATANEISDVIQIINRIAAQINLLSLNATIEAARAGEAGKGFEVVASEVKNLARQVSNATEGIAQRVKSIQDVTNETVIAMDKISSANRKISETTNVILGSMHTQAATTSQIADNIKISYNGTKKVAEISHKVSESTTQTKQIVQDMRSVTGDITQQSTMLEMQVKNFINRISNGSAATSPSEVSMEDVDLF